MTYPPPPGAPGDPGQNPMSDPYAPGGGYGPPPGDPYGQQPQPDPYGTPPPGMYSDPYSQPPMSGPPMSPAPHQGYDPYGQQMGMPGQQPFFGAPPPPPKNNLGWIIGGIGGAAVLIILVVIGVIVIANSGDDNGSDSAGGSDSDSSSSADSSESTEEESGGGSGTYKVDEGVCEKVDTSKVPSSLGLSSLDDISFENDMYCANPTGGNVTLTMRGKTFDDAEGAKKGYEEYTKESIGGDGLKDFSGGWEKGEISQYSNLEGTAHAVFRDGNMAMIIYLSATDSASNEDAKEAAKALAEGAFAAASA